MQLEFKMLNKFLEKRKVFTVIIVSLILMLLSPFIKTPLYLNLTPSEKLGIYLLTPLKTNPMPGDLVLFAVPNQAKPYILGRGWMKEGGMLLKHIGAVKGDKVLIDEESIFINGKYIGPVSQNDSKGLPLPKLRGEFKIKPDHFLPIATNIPNSFDGRYFGPVPYKLIKGEAIPIFLWKQKRSF